MDSTDGYDLSFRPATYWVADESTLANIKGHYRRVEIATSGLESVPPALREEDIGSNLKQELGSIVPWMRSGEDLPDHRKNEVEIARLRYTRTVHQEVTSIRARRTSPSSVIRYRCVTEFEEEGEVVSLGRKTSRRPLTLRELIELIDTAETNQRDLCGGLVFGDLQWNLWNTGMEPEDLRGWIEASSMFYPQLGGWYEQSVGAWLTSVQEAE